MGDLKVILLLFSCIFISQVNTYDDNDCQDGWSSCDSSVWVLSKYNTLSPYTPGENVEGSQEYEIKFSCRGRRNGYYADLDHSCKVWHYCNTSREVNRDNGLAAWTYVHYSYVCSEENTRYDQVLRECVPESKSLVRCQDSESYFPTGDYIHHIPALEASNNRLVPLRCPNTDVPCTIQDDHINLRGCPEPPGSVSTFEPSTSDVTTVASTTEAADEPSVAPVYSSSRDILRPIASHPLIPHSPGKRVRFNLFNEHTISSTNENQSPVKFSLQSASLRNVSTWTESRAADFLGLPYGSTKILGDNIDTSFNCYGRSYGYYADVNNHCKVYHVCSPKHDEFGKQFYEHYSFVCAEGLIFDQQKVTCVPNAQASSECLNSEKFYHKTASLFNSKRVSHETSDVKEYHAPVDSTTQRTRKVTVLRVKSLNSPRFHSKKPIVYTVIDKYADSSSLPHDEPAISPVERYQQPQGRKATKKVFELRKGFRGPAFYRGSGVKKIATSRKNILHSPVVAQDVSGLHVSPRDASVAHVPSVSQYIASPGAPLPPVSSLSHQPTISQYIASVPSANAQYSHPSTVHQYSGVATGSVDSAPQSIVHAPSIRQVIIRPEYLRPSSRFIN